MSFRFWCRIRIAPGVTLAIPQESGIGHAEGMSEGRGPWTIRVNLSKSGGSLSFGVRGAHFTVGPHGKRVTAGISINTALRWR